MTTRPAGPSASPVPPLPRAFWMCAGVSLVAMAVNILGEATGVEWMHTARWFYTPPLVVGLVLAGGLSSWRGWLWAAGLLLSAVGDTQGGHGFLILLGSFLLAHLAYIAALWPDRKSSWLGRPGALIHLALLVVGLAVVVPAAGPALTVPVIVYGVVLALMAVLATSAGRVGLVGGLLFIVSDMTLAIAMFAAEVPVPVRTLIVIGTYVPAQILLTVAMVRLFGRHQAPLTGHTTL